MKKGIGLVSIVMVVMVLIGTMMVPAHADYEKTATFKERFEVLFDLYLKREGLEDYFVIESIEEQKMDPFEVHFVNLIFTDKAISELKDSYGIESDDVYAVACLAVLDNYSYILTAVLYVDGEEFDTELEYGDNILEDLDLA